MCCRCGEKFADPDSHKQHVLQEHMDSLSPKLQAVLPPNVDSEWTEMLLTFPWRALDANTAVRMIELQSNSPVSNSELASGRYSNGYGYYEDAWGLSFGDKKYAKIADCVSMECDQSEGCKAYFNPDSWPLSNDIERTELLEKIKTLFQLLIKHKCLAASHLTKVIQFAVEELHPQLLNCSVEQIISFMWVGRYSEKSNAIEELTNVTKVNEVSEKIAFDKDGSSLLLDANTFQDNDDDSLLSWIFSGPTSQEQLTFWTKTRDEKMHKGIELLEMIGKEFSHLQSLCDRKSEHVSYEEALQLVEDLCVEEGKKRENTTEFVRHSYESVLRKRRDEITQHDDDATCVNRFEVEALTNVLKEVDSFNVNQYRFEDSYGVVNVNSHACDLESGEEDWRVNDYLQQLDTCIEIGIQKQKEQLSVELSKIDARIMRNLSDMQQLEAKLGPLCALDFGLIVVPLVKSYLRAHLETLAEKDATEKSDAAREAFLAELALDSKKASGDVTRHVNDKLKDKERTRNTEKQRTSRLQAVEDEATRRKIELEAEERKLEETLKYQRRIEDEAKQRHLAEQHKNSSRTTPIPMTMVSFCVMMLALLPILEPVKQSNGLLSPPEDGLLERTGNDCAYSS
ncbi:putative transcription factor C2H2 family [Helianthus annuus]|nr:putative transcription factor C2H2 family [Helianthus annuus]